VIIRFNWESWAKRTWFKSPNEIPYSIVHSNKKFICPIFYLQGWDEIFGSGIFHYNIVRKIKKTDEF